MSGGPGMGNTPIRKPSIQLPQALEPRPGGEKPFPGIADLVLHLPLFPSRSRRAGHRLDQVMRAHPLETAVELPLLADEHRIHRRLHVVVDATPAGAAEQGKRSVVGVEDHLLRLAGIGHHQKHPAVTEPDMGHLDPHRHPRQQHVLVAPIELIGFTRGKPQRNEGIPCPGRTRAFPLLGVPQNAVVAALVAALLQNCADLSDRPAAPGRLLGVLLQQPVQIFETRFQSGPWLGPTFIAERGRSAPDDLPYRVPRDLTIPHDRLDRLAIRKIIPTDLRYRFHNQHSPGAPSCPINSWRKVLVNSGGSNFDAVYPHRGVKIARCFTLNILTP